ncbi:MAG TPA: hypothetical protein VK844_04180 [Hyphomicrobiales bacterium]|nr:hypothetical protein [Hyphomicrobiales bacterium]
MESQEDGISNPADRRRLDEAIRKARIAQAEQTDVVVDLRAAELARLAMIEDELKEIASQLPEENDQFDFALVPGNPPRLWIDMVSFVMMGRDRKTYRFVKDTRSGRQVIAESADPAVIGAKVTDYVAHRIVERERLLAGEPEMAAPGAQAGGALSLPSSLRWRAFGLRGIAAAFLVGLALGALCLLLWGYYVVSWLPGIR